MIFAELGDSKPVEAAPQEGVGASSVSVVVSDKPVSKRPHPVLAPQVKPGRKASQAQGSNGKDSKSRAASAQGSAQGTGKREKEKTVQDVLVEQKHSKRAAARPLAPHQQPGEGDDDSTSDYLPSCEDSNAVTVYARPKRHQKKKPKKNEESEKEKGKDSVKSTVASDSGESGSESEEDMADDENSQTSNSTSDSAASAPTPSAPSPSNV